MQIYPREPHCLPCNTYKCSMYKERQWNKETRNWAWPRETGTAWSLRKEMIFESNPITCNDLYEALVKGCFSLSLSHRLQRFFIFDRKQTSLHLAVNSDFALDKEQDSFVILSLFLLFQKVQEYLLVKININKTHKHLPRITMASTLPSLIILINSVPPLAHIVLSVC